MLEWAAGNGYTHAGDLGARAGEAVGGNGKEQARVWGQVITYKRIPTKRTKEAMAFVTLEDPTGLCELVFFPKAYARLGSLITSGRPLVVEGKVENDRGGLTLTVSKAWAVRCMVPEPVKGRQRPRSWREARGGFGRAGIRIGRGWPRDSGLASPSSPSSEAHLPAFRLLPLPARLPKGRAHRAAALELEASLTVCRTIRSGVSQTP